MRTARELGAPCWIFSFSTPTGLELPRPKDHSSTPSQTWSGVLLLAPDLLATPGGDSASNRTAEALVEARGEPLGTLVTPVSVGSKLSPSASCSAIRSSA